MQQLKMRLETGCAQTICFSLASIQQGDYKLNINGFMLIKQKQALLYMFGEHALCLLKAGQSVSCARFPLYSFKAGGIKCAHEF